MKAPPPIVLASILTDPARRAALHWEPFREGIEVAWIYQHGDDGPAAAFLRYHPGAQVPAHDHVAYEHILVLEGAQEDDNGRYGAGTVMISRPGSSHAVASPEGCLVLAFWERPVRFRNTEE